MATPDYTEKKCQYLAFIFMYTKVDGRPPAITDIARLFKVTPPSAQRMVDTLTKKGLAQRTRGTPRSLRVLLNRDDLSELQQVRGIDQNPCEPVLSPLFGRSDAPASGPTLSRRRGLPPSAHQPRDDRPTRRYDAASLPDSR